MRVPWRRVASWHCTACGECCHRYRVTLTFYEYLRLKNTGFVEDRAFRYYIRKIGKRCPFQIGRICSLQGENKPLACKLFPFTISKKGKEEALYEYNGKDVYVYVDVGCPNIVLGRAGRRMELLVREAVQLYFGEKRSVDYITSPVHGYLNKKQSLMASFS